MNPEHPHQTDPQQPAEPDAFERQWLGKLAEPDPELSRSADTFVAGVLDRHAAARRPAPAIAGRIGMSPLPYAAAAVLLIAAALLGFYLINNGLGEQPTDRIAIDDLPTAPDQQPPQPAPNPAVAHVDPSKLKLGNLIARTRTTVIQPANNLTNALRQSPPTLSVKQLLDLIDSPVPDMKELLAPLAPKNPQSRA